MSNIPEDIEGVEKMREALVELAGRLTPEEDGLLADLMELMSAVADARVLAEREAQRERDAAYVDWYLMTQTGVGVEHIVGLCSDLRKGAAIRSPDTPTPQDET